MLQIQRASCESCSAQHVRQADAGAITLKLSHRAACACSQMFVFQHPHGPSTFCRVQKRRRKKLRRNAPPLPCTVQPNSLHSTIRQCPASCPACSRAAAARNSRCDALLTISCPAATVASATSRVANQRLHAFHCHLALPPSPSARCSVRTPLPPLVGKLHSTLDCSQVTQGTGVLSLRR